MKRTSNRRPILIDDSNILLPIMNMMVILIPMLISNLAFFHLKSIEVNTPSVTVLPPDQEPEERSPAQEKSKDRNVILQLSVTVPQYTFELIDEDTGEVVSTLHVKPTDGDLSTVTDKLMNVKKNYPKLDTVLVMVESDVRYEQMVKIFDKCNLVSPKDGETKEMLKLVVIPKGGV